MLPSPHLTDTLPTRPRTLRLCRQAVAPCHETEFRSAVGSCRLFIGARSQFGGAQ